jgi:hypothetical protein
MSILIDGVPFTDQNVYAFKDALKNNPFSLIAISRLFYYFRSDYEDPIEASELLDRYVELNPEQLLFEWGLELKTDKHKRIAECGENEVKDCLIDYFIDQLNISVPDVLSLDDGNFLVDKKILKVNND